MKEKGIKGNIKQREQNIQTTMKSQFELWRRQRQEHSTLRTFIRLITYLLTYLIGHYNSSVRIIDLVAHTIYIVCVIFIHKWRDL